MGNASFQSGAGWRYQSRRPVRASSGRASGAAPAAARNVLRERRVGITQNCISEEDFGFRMSDFRGVLRAFGQAATPPKSEIRHPKSLCGSYDEYRIWALE